MLRILKLIAINAAVAVTLSAAFISAVEFYLRISVPNIEPSWPMEVRGDVGTVFQPHAILRMTDGVNYATEQRVNGLGFLDREPPPVESGECRVAFIGDSFVEAVQVPIAEKFHVVLEPMLADMSVRTMAFGYSGLGQINELAYYDHVVRALKPNIVILVVVSNDISNNSAALEAVRNGTHPLHAPRLFAREENGVFTLQPIDLHWRNYLLPAPPASAANWRREVHVALNRDLRSYAALFKLLSYEYPAIASAMSGERSWTDIVDHRVALLQRDPATVPLIAGWPMDRRFGVYDLDFIEFEPDPLPAPFVQASRFTDWAFGQFAERAERDHVKLLALATHSLTMVNDRYLARIRSMLRHWSIPEIDQSAWDKAHGESYASTTFPVTGHWTAHGHRLTAQMLAEYFHQHRDLCQRSP